MKKAELRAQLATERARIDQLCEDYDELARSRLGFAKAKREEVEQRQLAESEVLRLRAERDALRREVRTLKRELQALKPPTKKAAAKKKA